MDEKDKYSIRPAGRHILTIGRDLIQDKYAAIVELVKNAYDADSTDVQITFIVPKDRKSLKIVIEDHGHGMSRDTVINKWMVPSTDDKLKRKTSPNRRTMQGRKGVGRYAASILGNDLSLVTVTPEGEKTEVYVEWSSFENADYLDNVEILVKTTTSDQTSGTILTITGDLNHLSEWNEKQIQNLEFELKKLNSPISYEFPENFDDNSFSIVLNFDGFWKRQGGNISKKIEPYPIIDLYDYKISGSIEHYGKGTLTYTNQKAQNTIEETIPFDLTVPTDCGTLYFDIRVYDRDKEAIEQLIKRGLTDEKGNYVGNLQAKNLLNEYNGIGVYRNGFRIRPLGDPDFDWLKLNKRRVQKPSTRIGSDQVIGYVLIQSEELSNLQEKSARDGLRENQAYSNLKNISTEIIIELENRRFAYRKKEGLSRKTLKIETELEKLFEFDNLKKGVRSKLSKSGIDEKIADDIINSIAKKEEESNRIVEDIRQTVAIYQGQATLGKIVNVILHEGRKPLNFFKNSIPNFNYWAQEFKTKKEPEILDTIFPIVTGMGHNADIFAKLFGRLDPLAAAKRGPKQSFLFIEHINSSFKVFENELRMHNITYNIDCPEDLMFIGWFQDIYIIMTNLIDNSIYWMVEKQSTEKNIEIIVSNDGNKLAYIDYRDSGPGIANYLIETDVIFEPEFTTKNVGSGLGLPIAGEAASRNGLELKAFKSDSGAYFRLEPIKED